MAAEDNPAISCTNPRVLLLIKRCTPLFHRLLFGCWARSILYIQPFLCSLMRVR